MHRALLALTPLFFFFLTLPVFACSGEGAPEAMARNARLGWALWFVTLVILGAIALSRRLRARGFRTHAAFGVILLVHPGWWFSTTSGDCGIQRVELALLMTLIATGVAVITYVRAGRPAPEAARVEDEK